MKKNRMWNRKVQQMVLIMASGAMLLSGCGQISPSNETNMVGIEANEELMAELVATLKQESITLAKMDTFELELMNAVAVEWVSDNEGVATVSQTGLVTAVEDGECKVSVTTEDKEIFVCNVIVKTVELNYAELSMGVNQTIALEVINAEKSVVWTSQNESVATVSEDGVVFAVSEGETYIISECGNMHFECLVKVENSVKEVKTVAPENSTNDKASSAGKNVSVVETKSQSAVLNESIMLMNEANTTGGADCTNVWNSANDGNNSKNINNSNNKEGNYVNDTEQTYDAESECDHDWDPATCQCYAVCKKCSLIGDKKADHVWEPATCYVPETCAECNLHKGEALGHDYVWDVYKEPGPGIEGYRGYVCTRCGSVDTTKGVEILRPLVDGLETPWEYSNNGTHRTKTLYDGSILNEDLYVIGDYKVWGYFDEAAANRMNDEVNYMLSQVEGWQPFVVSEEHKDMARIHAMAYAIKGGCDKAYHANFGGMPNVDSDRMWITLMDAMGCTNYIECFVLDSYQGNGDYVYGQYWTSWFGTYYASGSF